MGNSLDWHYKMSFPSIDKPLSHKIAGTVILAAVFWNIGSAQEISFLVFT